MLQFLGVADIVFLQSAVSGRFRKVVGPFDYLLLVRSRFRSREDQCFVCGVVAILFQEEPNFLLDGPLFPMGQLVHAAAEEFLSLSFGGIDAQGMQVCGGKIRPEVRPMSPDGAVFHESIFEKYFLARHDILPGQQGFPRGGDNFIGNGRSVAVGRAPPQ